MRFKPQVPDSAIRAAARRVDAGESLRRVAADVGFGKDGHRALRRRIDALAERDARERRMREESRAVQRQQHPDREPVVVLASDVERSAEHVRRERRTELARAAEPEEISDAEFYTQWLERNEVASGRRTRAEVMQARVAGRRPITPESTRARGLEPEPAGLIYSPAQLLRAAFTGRL